MSKRKRDQPKKYKMNKTESKQIELKHNDDYSHKRTNVGQRFQYKKRENRNIRVSKDDSSSSLSRTSITSKKQKERLRRQQNKIKKEIKETQSFNKSLAVTSTETSKNSDKYKSEVYDPLGKDMDNDGIIDRYDNDFRDSDYEESTYDIDGIKKDEKHNIQKKNFKRKNYSELYHRNKIGSTTKEAKNEVKLNTKIKEPIKTASKSVSSDKKIKKYQNKLKKIKKIKAVEKTSSLNTMVHLTGAAKTYLRSNTDDNSGIKSAEMTLEGSSKLVHGVKDYKNKRSVKKANKYSKLERKIKKRSSKLEFREAKAELKKDSRYKKMSAYKKFQKRKQMKASIKKRHKTGIKDRIKKSLLSIGKDSKEIIKKRAIRLGGMLFGLFLFISMIMQSCSILGGFNGGSGMIASTSYMTSDREITVSDELMQELDTDILIEVQNIPKNYPGYDSYRYQVASIGHDPQVLIAYLTAKYGEYSFSEVQDEINRISDEMYDLELVEEIETYIEIEEVEVEDPETGEITIEEVEVEKTRRILITKLHVKRLEDVLKGKLTGEQKEHYETLLETKGNFSNLHSPIPSDWKPKVTSLYGYRSDPFTSEKRFHRGIDIADSEGTPLLALFDGTITKVSYDADGYGHYVELTDKEGNMALYAHASRITSSVGQIVKKGDEIAKMGTTGRSTGSHLHLELYLKGGIRVNPYFYLYSESAFNSYTRPSVSSFNAFNWQGSDAAETVWGYLVTNGYTAQAAAGIMGNIAAESGFNTSAIEGSPTNPGEGIGLIQWSFGRKAQLLSFANSQGKHWSDIGVQIAFLDYEMNGAEGTVFPGGVSAFKNLRSIEEATSQFCWLFERPNRHYAHYERRSAAAHSYYEMYKDFDASVVKP